LSASQTTAAFGIAATQASGLVEMLGSMARVLNAGFAARNGLQAALLAAEGFEGPARPLDGLRGFYSVFGGEGDKDALTAGLGQHWELTQVRYKPYPSGVVLHALLDACLDNKQIVRRSADIAVSLSPLAVERTNRPDPRNAIEARLSAHHAVAVAALRGRAGLAEFSDAAAIAPDLRDFRRKVRVQADAALDKMAAVVTAGGKTIQARAARVLDDAGIEAKLAELAGKRADGWLRFADSLESAKRVVLPD
jgi:2-methylcitrate dehydratase PrpD